ncbi:uncharacterized protein LOC103309183 [Acyrthosiphon pisum]|uniref:ATP-dependent DNA helicase n=1 Tax=Acyrthosiphon pisum TaxID=7029 RepID=A0A8R2F831_ACYPI|nr:uncharacterized protein LOC103309183 [Acyrthosiphon pisum]|eukprot:XP_008182252.1 PREDICTED: uncharacterized protein LOC103309183 [Acyrthosiphon pisum]
MTSFGAEVVEQPGYNPNYKVKAINSPSSRRLLPQPNEDHKFLQIYFVGNSENELEQRCAIFPGEEMNTNVSSMNFYAYRLMIRQDVDNHLLRYRRLFQQYCVDMYVKVETERLNFIRFNQSKLRSDEYIHLRDAIATEGDAANIGRLTILPATHIGSPCHMREYAQMRCRQTPSDRHDITARVFKQKIVVLMNYIVKQKVFGAIRCWMYSVEWQKRGLPHAHILFSLFDKVRPNHIDSIISAETPDPETDPELHSVVTTNMTHGPCGAKNPGSPCMQNGNCTKRFPRQFVADTISVIDGYPLYRRRSPDDNGRSIIMKVKGKDVVVDNRWIVPYCPLLSKTFSTHCNVEYCNSIKSIKYVCKYVNKGSDMAVFGIADPNANDEVMKFQLGRYVSCNEAIWRLFSFTIHERHPTVVNLAVHLENGQCVYFTEANAAQRAERPPATPLTNFFSTCESDPFTRTLLYSEMPRYYTWNAASKKFQRRKKGDAVAGFADVYSSDALGRIYTVHPRQDECFYLRLLLVNVKVPTSFNSLRTVDGVLCATFREACQCFNLLENDSHWDLTLADATVSAQANQIRTLFAIIIATCHPSNPNALWEKYKDEMVDDILHRVQTTNFNFDLESNDEMRNEALVLIEDMCALMCGSLLSTLGMPAPNRSTHAAFNFELQREKNYDRDEQAERVRKNVPLLNAEQKNVYDSLMKVVDDGTGGIYFLDTPGATGKTFVIALILATIRSRSQIALAVASSGIAVTLLEGGRTANSALKLPMNLLTVDKPTCSTAKNSATAKLMRE